jgi:hypothetical protein
MNLKNTQKALQAFSSNVERKAKANLKRKNKIASGDLYNSIKGDLKVNKNSFELFFDLSDYWEFVDYGVKGVGGTKADGSKWKLKKVTNNKFKYKDKKPPTIALNGWTIRKGIAPRDNSGRFTSRKGLLIAITKSIYHTGLETTSFFTRPFDIEFAKLEKNIVDSYALDVENFLEFSLKE